MMRVSKILGLGGRDQKGLWSGCIRSIWVDWTDRWMEDTPPSPMVVGVNEVRCVDKLGTGCR